jgi:hypothetical protein
VSLARRGILALVAGCLARGAAAQGSAADTTAGATVPCNGQRIVAVSINPGRPPFSGNAERWRALARSFGLHHATTNADVIEPFLLLQPGDVCNEQRRSDSERMLRDLPFIASASILVLPDSDGVRLEVNTIDEIPALGSVAFRGFGPRALSLGSDNVGGMGVRLLAGAERGYAYRAGYRAAFTDYAAFGLPLTTAIDAARDPIGSHIELDATHPFVTNFQRGAWNAIYRMEDVYPRFRRSSGDDLGLEIKQLRWSAGAVSRANLGSTVVLLGAEAVGLRADPAAAPVVISDSGFVRTTDGTLVGRYAPVHSVRAGALIGLRHVNYTPVDGLEALFARQDVMTGVQSGTLIAPGRTGSDNDMLISNSSYLGAVFGRSVVMADAESEARRTLAHGGPISIIASGRAAWYFPVGVGQLFTLDDEFSGGSRSLLPIQLTLTERQADIRGFTGSTMAGAVRNVVRAEYRWARPAAIHKADAGLALFTDVATLAAGAAPFGTNATVQSVGISLLGAYPSGSKRLYRIDVAYPLRGDVHRLEVRFTAGNRTSEFWREPYDVTRARLGPVPSSLFSWPVR